MYVFFGTGPAATNQVTASDGTTFTGLQVHKISLSTNQGVGTWDLSSPPQLPASFNSYDPSGNNISAAGFDNSGNLWIGYGNDNDDPPTSIPGGVRYTVRIQRANLT
jgi:hypothetical protein